jgi:hypothetical protein
VNLRWVLAAGAALVMFALAMAPSPAAFLSFDKAQHIAAFAALAILLRRAGLAAWITAAGLIALAAAVEGGQALLPFGRSASWSDFTASALGVAIGLTPLWKLKLRVAAAAVFAIAVAAQAVYGLGRPALIEMLARASWARGA